jgi:hypothetical protein
VSEPASNISSPHDDRPVREPGRWKWWVGYVVAVGLLAVIAWSADDWKAWGGLALLAALTGIRLFNADRELVEISRGKCRYCGHPLVVGDRECPGCERTVPPDQR